MKNVSILSMQRIDNYGSLLQAYALKKIVEEMQCSVYFMDIQKIDEDNALLSKTLNYSETGARGFNLSKINRYFINRIIYKYKQKKVLREFSEFREKELEINRTRENYDTCIIGSDEVFNCCNAGWWGFTTQLFGNIPEARNVITYAASCGATSINDLSSEMCARIAKSFNNISAFSVRDKNTREFVEKLSSTPIVENLDPVLVYDFDKELKSAKLHRIKGKFCLIYAYANRITNKSEYEPILKFCKDHRLIPVALGCQQFWCKDYIVCSPFECMKLFQNAEFVITDTFHGTIFAAKYSKKFVVFTRPSNSNKLDDLIVRLGIEKHKMMDFSQIDKYYQEIKDDKNLREILEREKKKTREYLRLNLNETKQV